MKKRLTTILAFTAAVVLVSSITYAATKKKEAKSLPHPSEISEEEALKAELLGTTEENEIKVPPIDDTKNTDAEEFIAQIIAPQPRN